LTAQNFSYQAKVDSTLETGFHTILVSPLIRAHVNVDFSDIRLFDDKNAEIPYLKRNETPISYKQLFKEYRIISNTFKKGCCTELIIENKNKRKINNISLLINNSDVQKKFKLSGSDDQKNWYVIKDNYLFHSIFSDTEIAEIKLMNFPLSDYAFFKIEIDDSASASLKINKAGYYDTEAEEGKYSEIPVFKLTHFVSKKDKKTYVRVLLNEQYYLDKLELKIEGPTYYLRNASISKRLGDPAVKWDDNSSYESIQTFELASNNPNIIDVSGLIADEFYIIIENDDNQPLHISSLQIFQLNSYLTAHLEKGKHYTLKFGDKNLSAPVYDLKYFENSIPETVPVLKTGEIISMIKDEVKVQKQWLSNKAILWTVIGIVIVFMTILSLKMIREMK
jgi:hypothetical protein